MLFLSAALFTGQLQQSWIHFEYDELSYLLDNDLLKINE